MPHIPLCCKLLEELDDIDRSFKRARLTKYLQDVSIGTFTSPSSSDSDSANASLISSISSVSSGSVSSASSLDSDDESFFQSTPLPLLSDIEEMHALKMQAKINKLHQEILGLRVLCKNPAVQKASQIHLLDHWHNGNLDQYRKRIRVDPNTFDGIVNKIRNHDIFHNNSNVPQAPVEIQLAIFLF